MLKNFFKRISCILILSTFLSILSIIVLYPIFTATSVIIPYAIHPFDICEKSPKLWYILKITYIFISFLSYLILSNSIFVFISKKQFVFKNNKNKYTQKLTKAEISKNLNLFIGKNLNNEDIYIEEPGLYQNILITGTIGSGKTSSAMYPFTKQLIDYKSYDSSEKLAMLILDVKGNYYKQVKEFVISANRLQDLIVINLSGKFKYNPLDKPNLKASVLANRLKTIMTLFSQNNGESYWLDKTESILTECIKFCRLYNNNYVTFLEIHKLITIPNYFTEKLNIVRGLFQRGNYSKENIYNLLSSVEFFEKEFNNLDSRTLAILKSEITRITNVFVSDYNVLNTFCPPQNEINFYGFTDALNTGKIIVLNMNIAEYKNLSKIIAAYLKLDFQSEVLARLSVSNIPIRKSAFISDEYHEYVTLTDGDFFSQSREAKCINIVATQSYTSLLNTLKENSSVKVIIQSLVNKLWFRTDDIFTIEEAQKQIGKEEKEKASRTISENAKETNYNYLLNSLISTNSNLSESINTYTQFDYIFDTNFFSQNLETFNCLAFISNGFKIIKPFKLKLIPYFKLESIYKNNSLKGFDLNEK